MQHIPLSLNLFIIGQIFHSGPTPLLSVHALQSKKKPNSVTNCSPAVGEEEVEPSVPNCVNVIMNVFDGLEEVQ